MAVHAKHINEDGFKLGSWVSQRRNDIRKKKYLIIVFES